MTTSLSANSPTGHSFIHQQASSQAASCIRPSLQWNTRWKCLLLLTKGSPTSAMCLKGFAKTCSFQNPPICCSEKLQPTPATANCFIGWVLDLRRTPVEHALVSQLGHVHRLSGVTSGWAVLLDSACMASPGALCQRGSRCRCSRHAPTRANDLGFGRGPSRAVSSDSRTVSCTKALI